eukprot:1392873-Rhodomonas_salina.1
MPATRRPWPARAGAVGRGGGQDRKERMRVPSWVGVQVYTWPSGAATRTSSDSIHRLPSPTHEPVKPLSPPSSSCRSASEERVRPGERDLNEGAWLPRTDLHIVSAPAHPATQFSSSSSMHAGSDSIDDGTEAYSNWHPRLQGRFGFSE